VTKEKQTDRLSSEFVMWFRKELFLFVIITPTSVASVPQTSSIHSAVSIYDRRVTGHSIHRAIHVRRAVITAN